MARIDALLLQEVGNVGHGPLSLFRRTTKGVHVGKTNVV